MKDVKILVLKLLAGLIVISLGLKLSIVGYFT